MADKMKIWVYADVVCDLFHAGHVEFFRKARSLGDGLIVGVHNDNTVAIYKPRPIMTMAERIAVVGACRYVDRVLPDAPLECTVAHLDAVGADFACHGDDLSYQEIERMYGDLIPHNRLKVVSYTHGIASRELIERIAARLRDGSLRISVELT
jgi:cytidyltransferase-like protein